MLLRFGHLERMVDERLTIQTYKVNVEIYTREDQDWLLRSDCQVLVEGAVNQRVYIDE